MAPCLAAAPAEVLRQQAIAGGAGGTRVPVKRLLAAAAAAESGAGGEAAAGAGAKGGKGAGRGPKGSMGYEGEDAVSGWTGEIARPRGQFMDVSVCAGVLYLQEHCVRIACVRMIAQSKVAPAVQLMQPRQRALAAVGCNDHHMGWVTVTLACACLACAGDGPLKLLLPLRFGESTWMAAAWKVLSEVGPEGLPVVEVRTALYSQS